MVVQCGAVTKQQRLERVLRFITVACGSFLGPVFQGGKVGDRIPDRDQRQPVFPMRRFGEADLRVGPGSDEEDTPPFLGNAIFFGFQHLHFDPIAEAFHTVKNFPYDIPASNRGDACHILRHQPTRLDTFDDAKIFAEQACSGVVRAALMVLDPSNLGKAGRPQ